MIPGLIRFVRIPVGKKSEYKLPRVTVDYRGLLAYAKQKDFDPAALSENEKNRFVTRKPDQEQTA